MDHGFEIDADVRCRARTKKEKPCSLHALKGIDLCALHSGLARAKDKPGFGDQRALDAYKRGAAPGPATAASRGARR